MYASTSLQPWIGYLLTQFDSNISLPWACLAIVPWFAHVYFKPQHAMQAREVISYMYSFKLSALRVTFGDHPRPPTQNFAQEPRRVLCFSWSTYIAKLGWWVCVSQTHSLQSQYQIDKLFHLESHWVSRCKLCVSVRWVPNSSDVIWTPECFILWPRV